MQHKRHNASQLVCLLHSSSSRSCTYTDLLLTRLKEIPSKPSSTDLRNKLWPFDTQARPLPVKRTLSQKCPNVFLLLVRAAQSFTCVNSSEKDDRSLKSLFVHYVSFKTQDCSEAGYYSICPLTMGKSFVHATHNYQLKESTT